MNELMPGVYSVPEFGNPTLTSPNSPFQLQFAQNQESLLDIDFYKTLIKNAVSRFRRSRAYKNYKNYLMGLGLDHCQFHANIDSSMATLEMHHNMLTIFDIAVILCEHMVKTQGFITSFDLVNELEKVHTHNKVQLVMLSLSAHQLYHNTDEFYIHPDMCFGDWVTFLKEYRYGITRDIAFKVLFYLKDALEKGTSDDAGYLQLRKEIEDYSLLTEML